MKLYLALGSPNCRKVQAVVHQLGLSIDTEYLDPSKGEHKAPGFMELNPNGMVPLLTDGTFQLWESHAIMQYLCDTAGDTELFPRDPNARADIARWQCWELAHFGNHLSRALLERVFKPFAGAGAPDPDESVVGRSLEAFATFAQILDHRLEDRSFVCGSTVTLADFSLGAQLGLASYGRVDLTPYPNLRRWVARLDEVDAWAASAMPDAMRAVLEERLAIGEPVATRA
ncbi:MAG: glutathione S-transferase family protein [Myxococcota bacterium]